MILDIEEAASKIPIKNLWYLLLYAWDMASWISYTRVDWEESPGLLGLLAKVLVFSTRELLKRQLGREFCTRRSLLRGIKGRVDFSASIKHLAFQHAAAVCSFPELSVDTLKNQIIRGTLDRLAGDPRIGIPDKPESTFKLRQELRFLAGTMEFVTLRAVNSHDFSRLQLGQNDRGYRMPLAICALIHRLGMPTEDAGDTSLARLLKDEETFHVLFERFIRNFYRIHLHGFNVTREWLNWHDEFQCALVPTMKTDISISQTVPPFRRVVVDTKYSINTLTSNFGAQKFKSKDLYQIYAYLRTQEHVTDAHRIAEGILLYPATSYEVDAAMKVQGHQIRVRALKLSDEWTSIHKTLLTLICD
jgi:5-methylcytosine-specific restriction enzyme subunit McrC